MIHDRKRCAYKALLTLLAALVMLWAAGCGGNADAPAAETEPETAAAVPETADVEETMPAEVMSVEDAA